MFMPKKMRLVIWIAALLLFIGAFALDALIPLVEDSGVLYIH
jgi:hypothetical protein